jgi:hypothetical protein
VAVSSGSRLDSQSGELATCLPSFDLMTPDLLMLAADGLGKKHGPVTGSLEAA